MTWSIHRTIAEHADAQLQIDAAAALYPRFGEAWEALKWLLARRADVLGYHKTVGGQMFRIYKQAGDILAQTPAIAMRMSMRRFTRLTNAFSKKLENHCHALALYFVWYNFCRTHKAHKMSPAMAAGVTDKLMSLEDVVLLIDRRELAAKVT